MRSDLVLLTALFLKFARSTVWSMHWEVMSPELQCLSMLCRPQASNLEGDVL